MWYHMTHLRTKWIVLESHSSALDVPALQKEVAESLAEYKTFNSCLDPPPAVDSEQQ